MKISTSLLIVGILVVLSFGLVWAQSGQGNYGSGSQNQNQTWMNFLDRQIDYPTALRLRANLKKGVKFNLNTGNRVGNNPVKGGFFGRTGIQQILAQPGAVALHYYFGQTDTDNKPTLIVIGVDSTGSDMTTGLIMTTAETGAPCPPFCPE